MSCVFGMIGAYAYLHFEPNRQSKATTVRASRFELTDDTGRVVAFWGIDRGNNTVLAFLRKATQVGVSDGLSDSFTRFTKQNSNEAFAVGLISTEAPFMNLLGDDGQSRAFLYLNSQQKPVFAMSDERFEGRLTLGFVNNDAPSPRDDEWALLFRGPDVAGIGSVKDPTDGKYRGYFSVKPR